MKTVTETLKKFKPYPAYKNSGVEWLGEIPANWNIDRLKSTIESCQNGIWGEDSAGNDDDVICVRVADFDRVRDRVNLNEPTLRRIPIIQLRNRLLSTGNLLLEKSGGGEHQPVGAVVLYDHLLPAVCSNFIARVRVNKDQEAGYLCYLHKFLYSTKVNLRSIKQSTGIQNLDSDSYFNEYVGIPDRAEQHAIDTFLNRETAKIDALIAKKERLIELLQEKRTALISRVVTKGLDPNVPMKDSGVEWLGEIPAHWELKRLKYVARLKSGDFITSADINQSGEYCVYGGNGLRGYTSSYTHDGDFVLIGRQGALCGCINYASGCFWASEHAVVATLIGQSDVRWFGELLRSMNLNRFSQSAAQPGLAVETLAALSLPVPSALEQQTISKFIASEITQIDDLVNKVRRGIEYLKEYRTVLISAAVTGKIDVREEVPS